ncbi:type VII secretion protein EsaA [Bacillus sp. AFS040349]|uniref:type VII secretion protein EsaA n=1 Tax=Bacillus sp. AFS040349 TaxID=2033502 RepID=UPI000BFCEAFE|nr:type VII secretion protein EsaA [Bacillus sp. AFS040349]PGT91617.1 type VII secretion protein EsaA [Bacillus sp. AFS040349]
MKSGLWKLIIITIFIILAPFVFFQAIGKEPLKIKENATQVIAVVNEDIGMEEDGEKLELGSKITNILENDSNYNWNVVSRSSAENGLRNLKYDAVVYIPSDFSQTAMTYDENNPSKVNFDYKLQTQLNAVNQEKALLEIEQASKRVNKNLSSLYWNFIATDLNSVREEFDQILQKERDFQETMHAFYKPSSKSLAEQLDGQQSLLVSLQSSIQEVNQESDGQEDVLNGFTQNLSNFIQGVEKYKAYQEGQQQLLAQIQTESKLKINKITQMQQPRLQKTEQLFNKNQLQLLRQMTEIEQGMEEGQQLFHTMKEQQNGFTNNQKQSLLNYHSSLLDYYQKQLINTVSLNHFQTKIIELKWKLAGLEGDPIIPDIPDTPPPPTYGGGGGNDEEPENPGDIGGEDEPANPVGNDETAKPQNPEGNDGAEDSESPESNDAAVDSQESGDNEDAAKDLPKSEDKAGTENQSEVGNEGRAVSSHDPNNEEDNKTSPNSGNVGSQPPTSGDDATNQDEILVSQKSLANVSSRIDEVKKSIKMVENEDQDQLLTEMDDLSSQINNLNKKIAEKPETDSLKKEVKSLAAANDKLLKRFEVMTEKYNELSSYKDDLIEINKQLRIQIAQVTDDILIIIDEINRKEQEILSSSLLSDRRKEVLTEMFSNEIVSGDIIDLLHYYAYLSQYETTLTGNTLDKDIKKEVLENEELVSELEEILKVPDSNTDIWEKMEHHLPTTKDGLVALEDAFTVYAAQYHGAIQENHEDLMNDLTSIGDGAEAILEQIMLGELESISEAPVLANSKTSSDLVSNQVQLAGKIQSIYQWINSAKNSQDTIVDYTNNLQQQVNKVQANADLLNDKWNANVVSTELIRDDVFSVLGNAFVDGQTNGHVYEFLASPLQLTAGETVQKQEKIVPPVVVMFIVLLASLMIGFLIHFFHSLPYWLKAVLFVLLNLTVGFVISLYGMNIYGLDETKGMEWTIFTIMLMLVSSGIILVSFTIQRLVGAIAVMGMIVFYVVPLLSLTTPNFTFNDPMSKVYTSIQYGRDSLFLPGISILAVMFLILLAVQILLERRSLNAIQAETDDYNEAM